MAADNQSADGAAPRVSLSGTFGRGKTTLLRPLAAYLGVAAFDEVARRFLDAGHDLARGTVQAAITLAMAEREATVPAFVTDRSLIDALAYARIGMAASKADALEHEVFAACVSWCEAEVGGRYTHVVVVESDTPLPPALRGRESFRNLVADEILRVVVETGLPSLHVDGTAEENLRRAVDWVTARDGAAR